MLQADEEGRPIVSGISFSLWLYLADFVKAGIARAVSVLWVSSLVVSYVALRRV
jgi:hypothetical protein